MFALIALILAAPECAAQEPLPVPTRVEVYTYEGQLPCVPRLDEKSCDKTKKPVVLDAEKTHALNSLLRSSTSYDKNRAMKCHEPRHTLAFYYGSSILDVYDVCFACENVSIRGANPFRGCGDGSNAPEQLTFTADGLEKLRVLLGVKKPDHLKN